MGLIANIKTGFGLLKLYRKIKEEYMTKGMKSSEFWLVVITSVITAFESFKGTIDPELALKIGAILTGVYTIARAFVKGKEGDPK